MTVHLHDRSVALFQRLSKAASGTTIVVGSVVLLDGWLNLAVFTRLMPGLASMKANAALAFLAVGLALWLLHADTLDHRLVVLRRDCALLVVLVGGLTLSEYPWCMTFSPLDLWSKQKRARTRGRAVFVVRASAAVAAV